MITLVENPPWIDRILNKHWSDLEKRVGPAWMPVRKDPGRKLRKGDLRSPDTEFGEEPKCGHYGCVLETETPGIVCKISSDADETRFVNYCLENKVKLPTGIVDYYAIAVLDEHHKNRQSVSVIWRQEADQVGEINTKPTRDPILREEYITFSYCMAISSCAGALRHTLRGSQRASQLLSMTQDPLRMSQARSYVSAVCDITDVPDYESVRSGLMSLPAESRVTVAVSLYELLSEMMEHENQTGYRIGEAFSYFFDQGIMLADVHWGNLGVIESRGDLPAGDTNWAITDPGHAVFIPKRTW